MGGLVLRSRHANVSPLCHTMQEFIGDVCEILLTTIVKTKRNPDALGVLRNVVAALCDGAWGRRGSLVDGDAIDKILPHCRMRVRRKLSTILLELILPSA